MIRPLFSTAWVASQKIYDPANPEVKVAKIIGGKVAENITAPGSQWANTCAVRMSYILNQSGVIIPFQYNKTVSGADKHWYFHYVRDLIVFLKQSWGKPDIIASYPPRIKSELTGKKGIILFEIAGWRDASGHATLWNGSLCYDHCYFNEPGTNYHTKCANFWMLK